MKNNIKDYKTTDCGRFGKATECAVTGKDEIGKAGRTDWRYMRKCFEIKTGAGELGDIGGQLCRGSSRVLYIPVPVENADGSIDLAKQEGFILTRDNFITALKAAGALREKTSTHGIRKVTIQTFWNRKQNKPHGQLYFRILDEMYFRCDQTIGEFLLETMERV